MSLLIPTTRISLMSIALSAAVGLPATLMIMPVLTPAVEVAATLAAVTIVAVDRFITAAVSVPYTILTLAAIIPIPTVVAVMIMITMSILVATRMLPVMLEL